MCEVYMSRMDRSYLVTVTGHAAGSSEACAGVSAIVYALAGYLENARRDRLVNIKEVRLDSGDARLEWLGQPRARAAFDMAVVGLAQIAEKYPEAVRVEVMS